MKTSSKREFRIVRNAYGWLRVQWRWLSPRWYQRSGWHWGRDAWACPVNTFSFLPSAQEFIEREIRRDDLPRWEVVSAR